MSRFALHRTRLAAAAALSLVGTVGAGAFVAPAHAECTRASVWIYKSQQGRDYKYGPNECVGPDDGLANWLHFEPGTESNSLPSGTPSGGGAYVYF